MVANNSISHLRFVLVAVLLHGHHSGEAATEQGRQPDSGEVPQRPEGAEEGARQHNAQLHAAVSVPSVAAAVAAATAASSGSSKDDRVARTDLAIASAATLVAAQCVKAVKALGADREHLAFVVRFAVSVRTPGDIITLTASGRPSAAESPWSAPLLSVIMGLAYATLRGAATLKVGALKDVWSIEVIPVEKGGNVGATVTISGL